MLGYKSIVVVVAIFTGIQPAMAFSPILSVNHWNINQLAKAGITIEEWESEVGGEDPPAEWVEITFDCSNLPKDQDVVMTAWLTNNDSTTLAMRAVRKPKGNDKVSLIIATRGEISDAAHVNVFIWKNQPGGGKAAHGYDLKLKRIAALAKLNTATDAAQRTEK